ncbi:MAG: antitoxin component YwqK of YwqJK toxin-antitoxin module [Bacteroidia bacterium]|jgi:antitoxin component YwqK of YwqJK toxin-antitoxin module
MKLVVCNLLLVFASCNQHNEEAAQHIKSAKPTSIKVNSNNPQLHRVADTLKYGLKNFSGAVFELNLNRDTIQSSSYQNGLLHRTSYKWYSDGTIQEKRMYGAGKKNGEQITYWPNGHVRFEFTAVADAYEGALKEWDVNKNLIHLAHFKNGQEEGIQKMWYGNGKIRANYVVKNGKRYGLLGTKNCINVADSLSFLD